MCIRHTGLPATESFSKGQLSESSSPDAEIERVPSSGKLSCKTIRDYGLDNQIGLSVLGSELRGCIVARTIRTRGCFRLIVRLCSFFDLTISFVPTPRAICNLRCNINVPNMQVREICFLSCAHLIHLIHHHLRNREISRSVMHLNLVIVTQRASPLG